MRTGQLARKNRRRGPAALAIIVAAIGMLSLGVLTVLGTPEQRADVAADGNDVAIALDVQRIESSDGPAYVLTVGAMASVDGPATLRFNSGQLYDFVISQDGREVWRWSAGRVFHQAIHERTIEAGTLQTFIHVWDGRDAQGEVVVGDVTVEASLQTNPVITTEPTTLTIDRD